MAVNAVPAAAALAGTLRNEFWGPSLVALIVASIVALIVASIVQWCDFQGDTVHLIPPLGFF
jgi:hypothetical protein